MKKNILRSFLGMGLIAIALTLGACSINLKAKNISPEEAKVKIEKYINEEVLTGGSKATIDKVTEDTAHGLYKMTVNLGGGQTVESYVTKDGKLLFPNALEVEPAAKATSTDEQANTQQPAQELTKSDKPVVELFVMSHCPYGTQIEKGMIPAVEALGSKIDFKLKFCDYAMHGEKELTEQLNQYCIQKEQNAKFFTYLKCFLKAGDSASCIKEAKIDSAKLKTCVSKTDGEFKVTENFKNNTDFRGQFPGFNVFKADNEKYGVGGSPTLVINGAEVQSERDAASLLKTICGAFNNQPQECQNKLSSDSPAPGFGTGTATGSTGDASCN